jgi:hypothetical protein
MTRNRVTVRIMEGLSLQECNIVHKNMTVASLLYPELAVKFLRHLTVTALEAAAPRVRMDMDDELGNASPMARLCHNRQRQIRHDESPTQLTAVLRQCAANEAASEFRA